jgi:hypothetical protein
MEDQEKIEKIIKDAKDLLNIFEDFKSKSEINTKSNLLKTLDRTLIAKTILPFLDLKDIINFRSTCRDINASVSSTVALVSYYKSINKKGSNDMSINSMLLKPFNELNDADDVYTELESVKKVKFK